MSKRSKQTYDLGRMYHAVYSALVLDLATNKREQRLCGSRLRDPRSIWENADDPPYVTKRRRQLAQYHKRLITYSDKSFDELSAQSFSEFFDSQANFGQIEEIPKDLLDNIRDIVCRVLGEFDLTEFTTLCAFGKRAAALLPRRKSYLDVRVKTLSGTHEQHHWFQEIRARDIHLMRATRHLIRKDHVKLVEALKPAAVPKSFKAARIMFPDTVLGGFLSRGVGNYVRARLEASTHINLALQQERHKKWAREASLTGHLSTLDMSKASDSFVWKHIELFVPESWHPILRDVRLGRVITPEGEVVELESYMLMGSGHTFPLQTLLFYAICEGVRKTLRRRGFVSCYGDDLIVPTSISKQCIFALEKLGFTVNHDKSFFDAPDPLHPSRVFFRESCGGDYKGGIDVRPFMPEDTYRKTNDRLEYVATLHKVINGLKLRWSVFELPHTFGYLLGHLAVTTRRPINIVPSQETEESGVRDDWEWPLTGHEFSYPINTGFTWEYFALRRKVRKRKQFNQRPYYWYKLWSMRKFRPALSPYEEEDPIELGVPEASKTGPITFAYKRTVSSTEHPGLGAPYCFLSNSRFLRGDGIKNEGAVLRN